MSDLLNKASLVVIPSGYKEDTVYSVVPTDGSGDLSFTRASNGTRVNSAGLVEVCPWNLLRQSETFDNATWSKIAGITSNVTTAPNGTTTADKISEAAVNDFQNIFQTVSQQVQQYTYSIYLKKAQNDRCVLFAGSSQALLWIDMTNWTSFSQTNVNSYSINAVGDGWYRVEFSYTNTASGSHQTGINLVQIGTTNTVTYSGNTANGLFIWGAQLNIGSTAKPYFPTTDRLNVPRLTYQNGGGGCPSLLLEKQSTNLFTYSEQFDNADWSKTNATITANSTTSPDGTQNADSVIPTTTNGVHRIEQDKATASQVFTQSIFAKANGYNFIAVENGGEIAYFNISTGVVGTVSAGTASIQNMGNGWYRCVFTATAVNSKSYFYVANADNSISFAGDATSGIFVWGAQSEASSYATSLINTTSASATRVADLSYKNSISSLIGQSAGVVFVDIESFQFVDGSYIGISDLTVPNRQIMGFESSTVDSGILRFYGFYNASGGTLNKNQRYKIAMAYANNDFVAYVNGVQVVSLSSGTISGTLSHFGFDSWVENSQPFQGKVNQAILFPTRLTNAELASLTTI